MRAKRAPGAKPLDECAGASEASLSDPGRAGLSPPRVSKPHRFTPLTLWVGGPKPAQRVSNAINPGPGRAGLSPPRSREAIRFIPLTLAGGPKPARVRNCFWPDFIAARLWRRKIWPKGPHPVGFNEIWWKFSKLRIFTKIFFPGRKIN